jgi:hypothetical protein
MAARHGVIVRVATGRAAIGQAEIAVIAETVAIVAGTTVDARRVRRKSRSKS